MAKNTWLYTENGHTLGPVTSAKIADLVIDEILDKDSMIQSAETGLWKKIVDIPEIVEIYHRPLSTKPLLKESTARQFQTFMNVSPDAESPEPIFWNIAWKKLFILNIVTLGLYEFYWFYRQASYIRESKLNHGRSNRISWIFFAYQIFSVIERNKDFLRIKRANFDPMTLGAIWFICLGAPYIGIHNGLIETLVDIATLVLFSYTVVPVQRYINECNKALGRGIPL